MRIFITSISLLCGGLLCAQLVITPSVASGFYDIEPPGVTVSVDPPIIANLQAGYRLRSIEPTLGASFQRIRATLAAGDVTTQLRNNDLYIWGGVAIHLPDEEVDRQSCAVVLGAGYLFDPADFGAGVAALRGGVDLRIGAVSLGLFGQVSYPDGDADRPWLTTVQLGVPLWFGSK